MEKKKRPLTLAGCIVNIVFAAIDIIAMIIMASTISNLGYMYGVYDTTFLVIPCIIEIIFALTILILSSILTAKHSKPVAEYKKYSGLVITLFVFNCIAVVSLLINIFSGSYLSILTLLVYAMCGTFILVDLCRNNKEYKNLGANVATQPTQQTTAQPQQVVYAQSAQNLSSSEKLMKDLIDIKKMKDAGIIDEKEYEELKSKIIANAKF